MFGKIKNKLKNLFSKNEEIFDDDNGENFEEEIIEEPKIKLEKLKIGNNNNNKDIKKNTKNEKAQKSKKIIGKKENEIEEIDENIEEEINEKVEDIKLENEDEIKIEGGKVNENLGFFSKVFGKKEEVEEIIKETNKSENEEIEEKSNEKESLLSKTFKKLKSKKITDNDFDKIWIELEIFLLEINIAFEIVETIETKLKEELIGNSFNRFKLNEKIKEVLANEVEKVLSCREADFLEKLNTIKSQETPVKIIVLGVNGTGKTTTIAKIVNYLQKNNLSVVVAAADTFRAAAIEQLEEHANKLNFKLIRHKGGSDPAAVAFDSIEHARAKNLDVVLIDTAGRMPNNSNLMIELQKIKRVSESQMSIFIGDSISGNDLIEQIELFDKVIQIDGVILTKVDTDEKPGSIVTTAYSTNKPIYFLGIGQTYDDLVKFSAKEIAQKLFDENEKE